MSLVPAELGAGSPLAVVRITLAAEAFASDDLGEGIQAFRERRKPRFKGR